LGKQTQKKKNYENMKKKNYKQRSRKQNQTQLKNPGRNVEGEEKNE